MTGTQHKQERAKPERLKLHAIDISVLIASSLFWSWYQLTILTPTLLLPFEGAGDSFARYEVFAFFATALALLFVVFKQKLATKWLDSRRWETLFVSIAVVGNALTMLGALFTLQILIIVGGVLAGTMAMYFLLAWARMYTRRGASATAPLLAGGFCLSFIICMLVRLLVPLAGAIVALCIPFLNVAVLMGIQALSSSREKPDTDVISILKDDSRTAFGATDAILENKKRGAQANNSRKGAARTRRTIFQIPLAFGIASLLFGLVFGFDVSTLFAEVSSLALVIACIGAALLLFLVAFIKPRWLRGFLQAGMLVGVAGFLLIPVWNTESLGVNLAVIARAIGFVSLFVSLWTALSGITQTSKQSSTTVFAPGLFLCYCGISLGNLFHYFLSSSPEGAFLAQGSVVAAFGFLMLIALLLMSNSAHLPEFGLLRSTSSSHGVTATQELEERRALLVKGPVEEMVFEYKLTEREGEILGYLLIGRSRPRIAKTLCVSENTINSHIQSIYRKMNVHSNQELLDRIM